MCKYFLLRGIAGPRSCKKNYREHCSTAPPPPGQLPPPPVLSPPSPSWSLNVSYCHTPYFSFLRFRSKSIDSSSLTFRLHVRPISISVIFSPWKYSVKRTNQDAPNYVITHFLIFSSFITNRPICFTPLFSATPLLFSQCDRPSFTPTQHNKVTLYSNLYVSCYDMKVESVLPYHSISYSTSKNLKQMRYQKSTFKRISNEVHSSDPTNK
jgi:hypothetical protein